MNPVRIAGHARGDHGRAVDPAGEKGVQVSLHASTPIAVGPGDGQCLWKRICHFINLQIPATSGWWDDYSNFSWTSDVGRWLSLP